MHTIKADTFRGNFDITVENTDYLAIISVFSHNHADTVHLICVFIRLSHQYTITGLLRVKS